MSKLFELLHYFFTLFCWIVTSVTCATTLYIYVFWGKNTLLNVDILWQILLVSAVCALESFVLYSPNGELPKKEFLYRTCGLFAFINFTVLCFGWYFQWFSFSDWKMIAGMELCIVAVFVSVMLLSCYNDQKQASDMNEKLKERQK